MLSYCLANVGHGIDDSCFCNCTFSFSVFPVISFSSTDVVVGESDGTAEVCLMLSMPLATNLTVAVTSTASGSATGKSA